MQHVVKLVILGRDGVLNDFRDDHVKAPEEWFPIPGALEAVARGRAVLRLLPPPRPRPHRLP